MAKGETRDSLIRDARTVDAEGFRETMDGAHHPGRYENTADTELTVALDVLSGHSGEDEQYGTESSGLVALRFGKFALMCHEDGGRSITFFGDEALADNMLSRMFDGAAVIEDDTLADEADQPGPWEDEDRGVE